MKFPTLYQYAQKICPKLSIQDWNDFEQLLSVQEFKPGQVVIPKGSPSNICYIVMDGLYKVFYLKDNYREYIKSFNSAHDIITCFNSILTNSETKISAECLHGGSLAKFTWDDFNDLMKKNHHWTLIGFHFLAQNLVVKEEREYELLTLTALERYKIFEKNQQHLINVIPQHQIASYLGITPVALTRLKNIGRTSPKKYRPKKNS
jgi:CRP-like cAMP-binding protein